MNIKIIYEDGDVLVIDKPAGMVVFSQGENIRLFHSSEKAVSSLISYLIEQYPELKNAGSSPRYGVAHRLDKDTSGVLLVAKTSESLIFLQKQFINRRVEKKYICLVEGVIKDDSGKIEAPIGRSPMDMRKQKAYGPSEQTPESAREAITEYKVLERFKKNLQRSDLCSFTLLEVQTKTGRRHQIRCHLSYLHHPIAGDKLYAFKNSKTPENLKRQFLHAYYLKMKLPSGEVGEFKSELPEDLENIIKNLEKHE